MRGQRIRAKSTCCSGSGVDSAWALIALALECDDDTVRRYGFARDRVSMLRFEGNDDCQERCCVPKIFVRDRGLISLNVLSVRFRTHMMLVIQKSVCSMPKGAPHFARHGGCAV
jgi:hypothetical protein